VAIEYRNLCVRKAELILIRNFSDRTKMSSPCGSAPMPRRIVRKGDRVLSEQALCHLSKSTGLLPAGGTVEAERGSCPGPRGKVDCRENVDEDSSPDQLKWYYRQTRAN